ncbi:MAG: T9SS type A sorting domain-containing protein [Ignavibacteriae bacterium]|nr:T9SS type A sorting domain-containing protein [Ignavibacteriota bacterium]
MKISHFSFYILLMVNGLFASNLLAQQYRLIDLGSFGGNFTEAYDINNRSEIVGTSNQPSPINIYGFNRAFIYDRTGLHNLGYSPTGNSYANAINDSGHLAVTAEVNGIRHGFLDQTDLAILAGVTYSNVHDINIFNHVVGTDDDSGAFVYYGGSNVKYLPWPGPAGVTGGTAYGINDRGEIVGETQFNPDPLNSDYHAFLYNPYPASDSQMHDLGTLGGADSYAYGINNLGQIVGESESASGQWLGFLWEKGTMQALPTLPTTGTPRGYAKAINDHGVVVGSSKVTDAEDHAFMWDSVNGTRDLNNLIPSGSGWLLIRANAINDSGQIVGMGLHNGQFRAFLLTPDVLAITSPQAGELWIAGEQDTIRWFGSTNTDSVNISYSVDFENNVGTFITVVENYPSEAEEYVWDIPDTLLSRKCVILIEDSKNLETKAFSDLFKIKGYELTRITAENNYERFLPAIHGWSFANAAANMWPSTWWSQFDYADSLDPYTNNTYPFLWPYFPLYAKPQDFIDWPLFVSVFGVPRCYLNDPQSIIPVYRPSSVLKWRSLKGNWGGSCFGFAISSFQAFDFKDQFIARFPAVGNFMNLNSLAINDTTRFVINHLFAYQWGLPHSQHINQYWNAKTPMQTLSEIKDMFLSEARDDRILCFWSSNGGHAVNPYRVVQDSLPPYLDTVYVYDNNSPGSTTQQFTINTTTNTWSYPPLGWSGSSNFILMDPVSQYLLNPVLPKTLAPRDRWIGKKSIAIEGLEIYNTPNATITLHDTLGNILGYADSVAIDSMPGGMPIIPLTGGFSPPIGYRVPEGRYSIRMNDFPDSVAYLTILSDSAAYSYARSDAIGPQSDELTFQGGYLSARNADPTMKSVGFESIIIENSAERVFDVTNLALSSNDSVSVGILDRNDLNLANVGTPKLYNLRLDLAVPTGDNVFEHRSITLSANSSHQISPQWNDLQQPVKIFIDNGNDGTIDDSMLVDNQVTGVGHEPVAGKPTEFKLHQNYPNPFNPVTTIRYELPKASHVTLKIFNVLGQEVAVLVDGMQGAGYKLVKFNASKLPSGVYFYRMIAGDFAQSRKLIIMK